MKIGADKYGHFMACATISIGVGFIWTPLGGFCTATIIGALKEIADTRFGTVILNMFGIPWKEGTPSWWDMLANVAGAGFGASLILFYLSS